MPLLGLLLPIGLPNWVVKHVRSLALPALFAHDGKILIDKSSIRCHAAGNFHEIWQG